jgi:hypothetical protein
MIIADREDGEDKEGQNVLLFKVLHGSAGYSSVVNTLIEGTGPCETAYFRLSLDNDHSEGNENRDTGMLQRLCLLTCDEGKQRKLGATVLCAVMGN